MIPSTFAARLRSRAPAPVRAKAFALLFVATFVIQVGGALALNLIVDPRSEFPTDIYEPLTENERARKLRAIALMEGPPDVLIVGSSRAASIDPVIFTSHGFDSAYNAALGSATTFDTLAVWQHTLREQGAPKLLVVAFEDWQLSAAHQQPLDLDAPTSLWGIGSYGPELLRSYHFDYLRDSLRTIELDRAGFPTRAWRYMPGGNVVWERELEARAQGTSLFDSEVVRLRSYAIEHYAGAPDPERIAAFHELVAQAREAGTDVIVFLTPMHPDAAEHLPPAYPTWRETALENAMDECGAGVDVYDFTDPQSYGGDLTAFVDGWHLLPDEAGRMIAHALAHPGACGSSPS